MSDNHVGIIELLDLSPVPGRGDAWRGQVQRREAPSVYGGSLVGQATAAAARTVAGKAVHSLHALFLRPGDFHRPIEYRVERLQDGRSFAKRRVTGWQDEIAILSAELSFHLEEHGASHQVDLPWALPDPDDFEPAVFWEYRSGLEGSFDVRRLPSTAIPDREGTSPRAAWIKGIVGMPESQVFHRAALAYLSDFELFISALERHGLTNRPGVMATSLDHAMWFHDRVRVDDWLLWVREAPRAEGSRGLTTGRFYQQGVLVATAAQEGLMRRIDRSPPLDHRGE